LIALAGPYFVVCGLLAVAGIFKVAQPAPTGGALHALHLPSSRLAVRGLGFVEITIGIAAAFGGGVPLAPLVGACYLAFAGFVVAARREGTPISSCGCFGETETPPSLVHIIVNLTAATIALVAAATDVDGLATVLSHQPWAGVPFVLLVGVSIYLAYATVTALPVTLAASAALHPRTVEAE
jgi:uncharacterized membrane protein YphA (DoxX/SURF4 family)